MLLLSPGTFWHRAPGNLCQHVRKILRMATLSVTFLGSGDACGRLQTCMLVRTATGSFLIDCGTTVLIAMRRFGIDPNSIDMLLLSHLHGDHFGGLPFFLLDAQLISKRTRPCSLLVRRHTTALHASHGSPVPRLVAGPAALRRAFLRTGPRTPGGVRRCHGYALCGTTCQRRAAVCLAYCLCDKIIAYSGDTTWTDSLIPAMQDADLCIAEAYFLTSKSNSISIITRSSRIFLLVLHPKRLILTHMSADMLARPRR